MSGKKAFCVRGQALINVDTYVWADSESDAGYKATCEVVDAIGALNTNAPLGRDRYTDLLHFEYQVKDPQEGESDG